MIDKCVCVCVCDAHCCCARGKNGNSRLSTKVKQNACCSKHSASDQFDWPPLGLVPLGLHEKNWLCWLSAWHSDERLAHQKLFAALPYPQCVLLMEAGVGGGPKRLAIDSARASRMLLGKRPSQRSKTKFLPPRCGDQRHHGNLSTKLSSNQDAKACKLCVCCNKVVEAATASRYVLRVCAEAHRPLS